MVVWKTRYVGLPLMNAIINESLKNSDRGLDNCWNDNDNVPSPATSVGSDKASFAGKTYPVTRRTRRWRFGFSK